MSNKIKAAIIGPGNIGTDLLVKAMRSELIEPVWMVGLVPESPGLYRAAGMGLKTTAAGVDGMLPSLSSDAVQICFDATSAYAHAEHSRKVIELGAVMIDLTPAAIGPFCVPPVNLAAAMTEKAMNVNMVADVQKYVPGYRLKNGPVFDGNRISMYLEVEGLGDFLPRYAGNLDIMTSAALRTAEVYAEDMLAGNFVPDAA